MSAAPRSPFAPAAEAVDPSAARVVDLPLAAERRRRLFALLRPGLTRSA